MNNTNKPDIPDLIAGALGVSRGTAYDMMRDALVVRQEPVSYLVTGPYEKRPFPDFGSAIAYCNGLNKGWGETVYSVSPLYTDQQVPVREWVGLTVAEIEELTLLVGRMDYTRMVQLAEHKLKEKNT